MPALEKTWGFDRFNLSSNHPRDYHRIVRHSAAPPNRRRAGRHTVRCIGAPEQLWYAKPPFLFFASPAWLPRSFPPLSLPLKTSARKKGKTPSASSGQPPPILVLSGTYEESIVLRERIAVVGANPRTTTINGEVRADTSSGGSIRGFSLQHAKGSALVISASSVAVSHCIIEKTARAAIQVAGSGAAAEIHSN